MDIGVDRIAPAVIGIDLHRGHLDPNVATMPREASRAAAVVEANQRFSILPDGPAFRSSLTQLLVVAHSSGMMPATRMGGG